MIDRSAIDRILETNRYLVLGTVDESGQPWVTPVFFAALEQDCVCWVSSPNSRHSCNIAHRSAIAITVFDSSVGVGEAEAAYFEADAMIAGAGDTHSALHSLNARLPPDKQLGVEDVQPLGSLVVYLARLRRSFVLVRGGNAYYGNVLDMTLEV